MDQEDPLGAFRAEFALPEDEIYLVGNSLGAPPRTAAERVRRAVEDEWGRHLVGGWNEAGWYAQPLTTGDRLAPLIGAGPGQVVVGNTTSIAVYQAVNAALRLRPGRDVIVVDRGNFPTDNYMVEGLGELRDIGEGRFDGAAAVLLSEVDYRTGARYDVPEVTARAQEAGALMIWDVCHSVGALRVDVSAADLAVGCTYKYLNGGPGAPAFLWVHPRHHAAAENVLSGWYAHAEPFAFEPGFRAADGIRRFTVSTPHVLSFAALEAALDIWERVDLDRVRAKSMALTSLFVDLVGDRLKLASPRDPERRGSQVSFYHDDGYPVMRALIDHGVHGDFRAPDILRFGFAPLYTRYVDVWDAAQTVAEVLEKELWREDRYSVRLAVT
ncbi:kynureninase [Nonomuraea sp. NPDC050790]|uniref:kynureninase n=1 Tax=Nonomuraea sp. NPDC050790 TaxID=3364371 RepID=UPI0037B247B5